MAKPKHSETLNVIDRSIAAQRERNTGRKAKAFNRAERAHKRTLEAIDRSPKDQLARLDKAGHKAKKERAKIKRKMK